MDSRNINIQSLKDEMKFLRGQLISPWCTDKAEEILDKELSYLHKLIDERGHDNFKLTLSFDDTGTLTMDMSIASTYAIQGEYFNVIKVLIKYCKDFDTVTENFEYGGNITVQIIDAPENILEDKYFSESLFESNKRIFFIRKVTSIDQVNIYDCINDLLGFLEGSIRNLPEDNSPLDKLAKKDLIDNDTGFQIYFTTKAYVQLLTEIADYPYVETGGVLVGQRLCNTFYIFETVDPGFKADRQRAEFSRHYEYTEHLAYKVANQYEGKTTVVGYYHRHPGSYDHFSGGDDISNLEFAQTFNGVISGLVNIDPEFRLAFYYISPEGHQSKAISYKVDDKAFECIMVLKNSEDLINRIQYNEQNYNTSIFQNRQQRNQVRFSHNDYNNKQPTVAQSLEKIYGLVRGEILFLEKNGYKVDISKSESFAKTDFIIDAWSFIIQDKNRWSMRRGLQIVLGIDKTNGNLLFFNRNQYSWQPYLEGIMTQMLGF